MKQAKIKIIKKTGTKCLHCYYDPKLKDWDSQIKAAEARLNPSGEKIPVICFPAKTAELTKG